MRARAWLLPLLALAFLVASISGAPPDRVYATHLCGNTGSPAGPYDFETYEELDYRYAYAKAMELAGLNQLFPDMGGFALPSIESGDRSAGSAQSVTPYVPPVLLKAIAWVESGWAQASYEPLVQYGEAGPTLISHDCGYGIMQITSGMQNVNDVPSLEQVMIGGHYAFNIARGARILAEKWNLAPEYRPVVGNRDPNLIENWYYALWGYNGFAFKNHPLNPVYDLGRPPYTCGPDRSGYPYQELVLGCVANPPSRGGVRLWNPVEVHLPNLNDPLFAGPLSTANWDACAYSLNCAAMDMPTPNPSHADPSAPGVTRESFLGIPTIQASHELITIHPPGGQVQVGVYNPASGVLAWRATTTAPWLRLSRMEGAAISIRSASFVVTADSTGMPPGTHTAQIVVESMYANPTSRVIQVEMRIGCESAGSCPGSWWFVNNVNGGGTPPGFLFGDTTDRPIAGDWDGDGDFTVGVWRNGWWYPNNDNAGGTPAGFIFGDATDTPIVGDWDGDGDFTVGVWRNGWWYLNNDNAGGTPAGFAFGDATDTPLVGDWDRDGYLTVGVRRRNP